jgi:hypothetical protein
LTFAGFGHLVNSVAALLNLAQVIDFASQLFPAATHLTTFRKYGFSKLKTAADCNIEGWRKAR